MSALLLLQFNPHKCNCCWDVQQYDGATRGPCHADCMPFSASYPGCPLMSYSGSACRSTALMSGASLSYTPKCAKDFGGSGTACVYKSPIQTNADCNCSGQWAQYCIDDPGGYRGRSWVVEFWCKDNNTLAVANYNVVIQDWQCLCDGAAHGFADGAGARFSWSLTIGGCCCNTCGETVQTNCCPDPIPAGLTATITSSCAAIDGAVINLTYNSTDNNWCGIITIGDYEWRVCQADGTLMGSPYCPIQLDCRHVGDTSWLTVLSPTSNGDMTCSPFYHSASGSFSDSCQCTGSHTVTVEVTA